MGGSALAISWLYVKSALLNPVTWFAMSGAAVYITMMSLHWPVALRQAGIEIGLVELAMVVFGDGWLLLWGMFLPFVFIVSPMLYAQERERLVAYRAKGRSCLWAAKVLAVAQLSTLYSGILILLCVALLAPAGQVSLLGWTEGYAEKVQRVASEPEGSIDVNYAWVVNEYLYRTTSPVGATFLQAALLLAALLVTGSLCAVLAQVFERQALTLTAVVAILILDRATELVFFAPQSHAMLAVRSAELPYWVSALYLASLFLALNAAGWYRQQKVPLG